MVQEQDLPPNKAHPMTMAGLGFFCLLFARRLGSSRANIPSHGCTTCFRVWKKQRQNRAQPVLVVGGCYNTNTKRTLCVASSGLLRRSGGLGAERLCFPGREELAAQRAARGVCGSARRAVLCKCGPCPVSGARDFLCMFLVSVRGFRPWLGPSELGRAPHDICPAFYPLHRQASRRLLFLFIILFVCCGTSFQDARCQLSKVFPASAGIPPCRPRDGAAKPDLDLFAFSKTTRQIGPTSREREDDREGSREPPQCSPRHRTCAQTHLLRLTTAVSSVVHLCMDLHHERTHAGTPGPEPASTGSSPVAPAHPIGPAPVRTYPPSHLSSAASGVSVATHQANSAGTYAAKGAR